MLNLFELKQKKDSAGSGGSSSKQSAAQLRMAKDIQELQLPKTCKLKMDNNDVLNFEISISPDEGYYKGGRFVFDFKVGQSYPHEAPKVKCLTKVYHPNIDLEGNVCLNILREDWKPVLTINAIVYGLQYLFLDPNYEDPLNKEAATVLQSNPRQFEQYVQKAMRGGYIGEHQFDSDSKVIVEYIADNWSNQGAPILPNYPAGRARERMLVDHVYKKLELPFYSLMMAPEGPMAESKWKQYTSDLEVFMKKIAMRNTADLSLADIAFIPYALRLETLVKHYFGFLLPQDGWVTSYHDWLSKVESHKCVRRLDEAEMIESYKRYRDGSVTGQIAGALAGDSPLP